MEEEHPRCPVNSPNDTDEEEEGQANRQNNPLHSVRFTDPGQQIHPTQQHQQPQIVPPIDDRRFFSKYYPQPHVPHIVPLAAYPPPLHLTLPLPEQSHSDPVPPPGPRNSLPTRRQPSNAGNFRHNPLSRVSSGNYSLSQSTCDSGISESTTPAPIPKQAKKKAGTKKNGPAATDPSMLIAAMLPVISDLHGMLVSHRRDMQHLGLYEHSVRMLDSVALAEQLLEINGSSPKSLRLG